MLSYLVDHIVTLRDVLGAHILFTVGAMVITVDAAFHKGSMRML